MLIVGGPGAGGGTAVPALPSYQLTGGVPDPLSLGQPQGIDLSITNPNPLPLDITSLSAAISAINAPRATTALPCSNADFTVQQYSGLYPLVVPASSTLTLQQLQVPASHWPQLTLLDLPTDQDGCQGASLSLTYTGLATLG